MSEDNEIYRRTWSDERYPARARAGFKSAAMPEGEDYFAMVAKHGRSIGPFEKERQLPYNVRDPALIRPETFVQDLRALANRR